MSKVENMDLKVQSIQKVPKGPMYSKGSWYPKDTLTSKVSKRYLRVQGIQKVQGI